MFLAGLVVEHASDIAAQGLVSVSVMFPICASDVPGTRLTLCPAGRSR